MKHIILLIILAIGISISGLAQSNSSSVEMNLDSEKSNEKQQIHHDVSNSFSVIIPKWLEVIETNNPNAFGGSLPKVKGIANAISIKSQNRGNRTLEEYDKFIVNNMKRDEEVQLVSITVLDEYKEIGKSYKVYRKWKNLMYVCQYVLVETKNAFLWIDFTATKGTYDINHVKFKEFMNGLEITK